VQDAPPSFSYALETLAPGRFPFARWRWELWHGMVLVSAGWVTEPGQVERALRRAASRRMHQMLGVRPLRPESARLLDALSPTGPARVDTGVGVCLLVPRKAPELASAAA
jgi:hypothetical protein